MQSIDEIDELINSFLSVGEHQVFWNADNYPSGIYILKLNGETDSQSQKVVLLKWLKIQSSSLIF